MSRLSVSLNKNEINKTEITKLRYTSSDLRKVYERTMNFLAVDVDAPDLCTRFVGRWVRDVRIGPSPDRIQRWLLAAGQRPVNNVVDASNVVMLELGKPIHTFDGDAIGRDADGRARIVVRRAVAGEQLVTLDHVTRELDAETLVIADGEHVIGIAGIMGGAASEVGEGTTTIAIESAIFDPVAIRRTAFRHALRSEASQRFEKGQEHRLARLGADRTARLIAEWAGGSVAAGRVDTAPDEPPAGRVAFRPGRVNRLLGTAAGAAEQRALLARVGIETEPAPADATIVVAEGTRPLTVPAAGDEAWLAIVPTWRRDLAIEADVAEEIARIGGYDAIDPHLPDTTSPPWHPDPLETRHALREALVGAGLTEVVTHALVAPETLAATAWDGPEPPPADGEAPAGGRPVTVLNPISRDFSVLRQNLLGSLLDVVGTNRRQGRDRVAVFEVARGYARRSGDAVAGELGAIEWWRLGIALAGDADAGAWNRPARPADIDDLKGLVELLAREVGAGRPTYEPLVDEPRLHPGRAATVTAQSADGTVLSGRIGEVHPALLEEREVHADRVLVAELSIAGLAGGEGFLGGRRPAVRSAPPPRFPAVERDIAVVVAEDIPVGRLLAAVEAAGGELLRRARLFDVYRGAPLAASEQTLAIRLTLHYEAAPLTEPVVDAAVAGVTAALEAAGGRLRT
jgi:phenylalanyl-tRNA synthetase beta chain